MGRFEIIVALATRLIGLLEPIMSKIFQRKKKRKPRKPKGEIIPSPEDIA